MPDRRATVYDIVKRLAGDWSSMWRMHGTGPHSDPGVGQAHKQIIDLACDKYAYTTVDQLVHLYDENAIVVQLATGQIFKITVTEISRTCRHCQAVEKVHDAYLAAYSKPHHPFEV